MTNHEPSRLRHSLAKVPQVTAIFWTIKILSTAMGEAASDFLVHRFDPYIAVFIGFIAFLVAIVIQLRAKKYVPWIYWLAVVMVAVFGTMAADVLHVGFGVPYQASTALFAATLTVIFIGWYLSEKSLSLHTIYNRKRELFYWATVIATFAMGTAAGDLAAYTAHLGFLNAGLFFAALFILPGIGYRLFGLNAVFAFWFAYIITRPLGASFADWAAKPVSVGGLAYGDGSVAIALTIAIVALVTYLSVKKPRQSHH